MAQVGFAAKAAPKGSINTLGYFVGGTLVPKPAGWILAFQICLYPGHKKTG
jgi:hypothetical protein